MEKEDSVMTPEEMERCRNDQRAWNNAEIARDDKHYEEGSKRAAEILRSHGIELWFQGCRGCHCPIIFKYQGEVILDTRRGGNSEDGLDTKSPDGHEGWF